MYGNVPYTEYTEYTEAREGMYGNVPYTEYTEAQRTGDKETGDRAYFGPATVHCTG